MELYLKLGSREGPGRVQGGSRAGKNIPNMWDAPILGSEPLIDRTRYIEVADYFFISYIT